MRYRKGNYVYLIANRSKIREAVVLSVSGEFLTIRFTDTGGGTRVREDRLYPTYEAAEKVITEERMMRAKGFRV